MTLEELKAEAKKHGYHLMKDREKVNLLDCTCGCNRRRHYTVVKDNEVFEGLRCIKCGKWVLGKTELDARKEWNKLIKEELSAHK